MIDSFLLWVFVWISKRWFNSVVFGIEPESERTSSVSFFTDNEHANQYMQMIDRGKKELNK